MRVGKTENLAFGRWRSFFPCVCGGGGLLCKVQSEHSLKISPLSFVCVFVRVCVNINQNKTSNIVGGFKS